MPKSSTAAPDDSTTVAETDPSSRPLVGIPVPVEQASWRVWSGRAHLLAPGYARHLREAGATPVLLPTGGDQAEATQLVATLDGLLLAGGSDVDPVRYGRDPHPQAGPFDHERDAWEVALLEAALDLGVPVFGICRGMQLINVVLGGTLQQHLPELLGTEIHNPVVGEFALHRVEVAAQSRLGAAVERDAMVPTYHHQAVDTPAPGLTPVAWSEDGVIEALEDEAGRVLAVQWHPEADEDNRVFGHFVTACRARRASAH